MNGSDSELLAVAQAMVRHSAERQAVAAKNIAHVNTPGYRAEKIAEFSEIFQGRADARPVVDESAPIQPNGNSVSLEQQVMMLAEAKGQNDIGLGIWEKAMQMYRLALGRRG